MHDHVLRNSAATLVALFAAAITVAACDEEDGDSGGDTAADDGADDGTAGADDGADGADDGCQGDGGDDSSMQCQPYLDCVVEKCEDCTDVCADYLACATGCPCGDTACQTDCLTNQSMECSSCFTAQATCAGTECSSELMACGA
jgi:hypothetical protein